MTGPLIKLIPLGGIGDVTKNMYVYEYLPNGRDSSDIIIVDCGIGFPDVEMYGIDLVIPDITYLRKKKDKIRGIFLTHGHEDHIGALAYLLPDLEAKVYATPLTAALAEIKLGEFNLSQKIIRISSDTLVRLGPFTIMPVAVTHSIPDAVNFIIKTPVGTFYHGSDFKFDWTPVDNRVTQVGKIAQTGDQGIVCLLSDCVRVEKAGYTLSEQVIQQTFETEIKNCRGKFIVTTQSSNISRLQQAINVALCYQRKIILLGRSIQQTVEVAKKIGFLRLPREALIQERQISRYPDKKLLLLVAGSQGQVDSALSRLARQENRSVRIRPGDKVVFSADPIPGNENAVYTLIDELTRLGAEVVYTDILEDLHVSGHGSSHDLRLMIALTRPQYLIPIGGTYRHMRHYATLATQMGYQEERVLLLENGQVVCFDRHGKTNVDGYIEVKNILVDGLGVGDVGNAVLRDRQQMATDGIVVVIVSIAQDTGQIVAEPDIISHGFVYMKEAGSLINQAKQVVKGTVKPEKRKVLDWLFIRKSIAGRLEEFFFRETHRRPLILPVVIKM